MKLCTFLLSVVCLAQTPVESIGGVVKDPLGAAIPGASVTLHGMSTRESITGVDGRYSFPSLDPATYILEVKRDGFEVERREVALTDAGMQVDVILSPAALRQSIDVNSSLTSVETVSKLPETLAETSRALSVFGAGELRDRNVRQVPELLAYVPGMSPNSYRSGGYHFYSRGYRMGPDDTRIDGFAGLNVGGGFGASLFGVEEAVMLRGPAGLLYGASGAPGGMVNLVTKKPSDLRSTRLDLRGGQYPGGGLGFAERPSFSFDLDSTGALLSSGRILYRALFTLENQRYFTAGILDRNRYANAQLTFKVDPLGRYTVTPIAQYARFNRPAGGGIVISPSTSMLTNDGISRPIHTSDLSPNSVNTSAGGRIDETGQLGLDFRAVPTSRSSFNFGYRSRRMDTFLEQYAPQVTSAAQIATLQSQSLVQRVLSKSDTDRRYHNFEGNGSYEFRGSSWRNTVQLGAYTRINQTRATTPDGKVPGVQSPINIYTGEMLSPLSPAYPALVKGGFANATLWNGYFQDRASLFNEKVVLTVGLGYGQNHPGGAPVQKGDLMPNFSVRVPVKGGVAVYGSYATSYNPVDPTLENADGLRGTFSPVIGKNYEVGAKWDLPNRRLSATMALFQNHVSNALVQTGLNDFNPNGNRYYVEAGTRQAKGVEATANYRLKSNWYVSGAAAYTSAIYTGEGPASAASTLPIPGSPAEKTPRWSWNARTQYQRTEGLLSGFGASFAILRQEERLGSNGGRTFAAPDPLLLPAYTRVDAAISYRFNRHVECAVNVDNLFDRIIFVNASVGSAMEIAPPRNFTTRLSYTF